LDQCRESIEKFQRVVAPAYPVLVTERLAGRTTEEIQKATERVVVGIANFGVGDYAAVHYARPALGIAPFGPV
jgi:hypothetical protein